MYVVSTSQDCFEKLGNMGQDADAPPPIMKMMLMIMIT